MKYIFSILNMLLFSMTAFSQTDTRFELRTVSEYILDSIPVYLAVHGRTIAVIGEDGLLETFDFSNPTQLRKNSGVIHCATLGLSSVPRQHLYGGSESWRYVDVYDNIALQWPYLFIPTSEYLQILDIGNPASLQQIGLFKPLYKIIKPGIIRVSGNRALYAYEMESGWILETINLSDLKAPKSEGHLVLPDSPSDILWDGGRYAYINPDPYPNKTGLKLSILDVSNPAFISIVASISLTDFYTIVKNENDILICMNADSSTGLHVVHRYDVKAPSAPEFVSSRMVEKSPLGNFPFTLHKTGNQWIGQNALGNTRTSYKWIGLYQLQNSFPVLMFQQKPSDLYMHLVAKTDNYCLFVYSFSTCFTPPFSKLILAELILPSSIDGFTGYQ